MYKIDMRGGRPRGGGSKNRFLGIYQVTKEIQIKILKIINFEVWGVGPNIGF